MKKIMLLIGLLGALQGSYCQNLSDSLRMELEQLSKENLIEGFGVSICTQDTLLFSGGFGYADREKKRPYTVQSVQKIASISKTILGVSLMKAQALGLLHLDDAANDYLPFPLINPYYPEEKISIRHLATHSAGLKSSVYDLQALVFPNPISPVYKDMPAGIKKLLLKRAIKTMNENEAIPMEDFLYKIYDPKGAWYKRNNFSKNIPGSKRMYSNNGAAFLALIIEKASGINYYDFVRKHILIPLEMTHTQFDLETVISSSYAKSSLYHAGIEVPNTYQLISYPAGGLETNIVDISTYMMAMMQGFEEGNQILSHQAYQEMMSQQINPDFHQGILWEVYANSIGHTGDLAGVTTHAYFSKETGITLILFSNTTATKNIYKETRAILEVMRKYSSRLTVSAK